MNEKELKLIQLADKDYVGYYIKYFRERLGLSQARLAKIIGVCVPNIGLYELGTKIPNEQFIEKLYKGINKYVKENEIKIIR